MSQSAVTADTRIADLLARCPAAMRVFFRRRMACVGCVMASFETIRIAAANYGLPAAVLVSELAECTAGDEAPRRRRPGADLAAVDARPTRLQ